MKHPTDVVEGERLGSEEDPSNMGIHLTGREKKVCSGA